MQAQDILLVVHALLLSGTIVWGVTGPRHVSTHALIVLTALFTPFVAFDWQRLPDVPAEAWLFCGAFFAMQVVHTGFHVRRRDGVHAVGPEILFQPMICVWVVSLRHTVEPSLWYRGDVGVFFFCVGTLFLSLAVLMLVYISEGTSEPGDSVDVLRLPLSSKGNLGFLLGSVAGLPVTLYVVTENVVWLAVATFAFFLTQMALGARAPVGAAAS